MLVHPQQAWSDASRVQRLARDGWLGFEHDSWALFSFTGKLWAGLGPVLVIAVVGLVLALRRRTRTDLILAAFVLVYLADLLTIRAHFDRYVLPLVPPLAVLAGRQRALAPLTLGLADRPARLGDRRRRAADAHRHARGRARLDRRGTCRAAPRVAAESSTPPLDGYRVLGLALPGPGRPFDPNRDVAPAARRGRAATSSSPAPSPTASSPPATATRARRASTTSCGCRRKRVYHVRAGHGLTGPWVSVYRL